MKRGKNELRARASDSSFPSEKVSKMEEKIERILHKKKINEKERDLLSYIRIFLLFRKSETEKEKGRGCSVNSAGNPYFKEVESAASKLELTQKEFLALNLWARGSRDREEQVFSERDIDLLYERIDEKLKNSPCSKA